MKSFTIASAFLAAAAVAQPHGNPHANHHRRHHQNDKRGVVTEVEWVTEYEYVTKLVDATTTVWVKPEDQPTVAPEAETEAPKAPKAPKKEKKPAAPAAPTTTLVTSVYTPPPAPESTTEAEPEVAPEPTSEYVAPVEPTTQAPAPEPTTYAPAPKAKPAAKPKSVTQPEPETETETPAIAPVQQEKAKTGGSSSGGSSASKHGEFTYYTIGLGACGGPSVAGQDEDISIVALSHLLMGEESNNNPMCGKTITIKANGKTTTAVVKDKCMGCEIDDIDVSVKVFKEIWGGTDKGRTPVEWWFN
ncbi:hypothetical protein FSARC_12016 [Fusarium sarcochroum]|uniref:Allergen Asp f 7 n=1 Tax=Fusarium sarcochroum TaxID=1208366 RepID=A0A8H4WYR5_9HYPO|nr:hypothetical protein FSARC_12016 [Fusarium sarcochroum]